MYPCGFKRTKSTSITVKFVSRGPAERDKADSSQLLLAMTHVKEVANPPLYD